MTGMYNHRLGLQANVIFWDTPWAAPKVPFLPEVLKPLGYRKFNEIVRGAAASVLCHHALPWGLSVLSRAWTGCAACRDGDGGQVAPGHVQGGVLPQQPRLRRVHRLSAGLRLVLHSRGILLRRPGRRYARHVVHLPSDQTRCSCKRLSRLVPCFPLTITHHHLHHHHLHHLHLY
jgi:hypothetical protein